MAQWSAAFAEPIAAYLVALANGPVNLADLPARTAPPDLHAPLHRWSSRPCSCPLHGRGFPSTGVSTDLIQPGGDGAYCFEVAPQLD